LIQDVSPLTLKSNITQWLSLKENSAEKGFVLYRGEDVVGKNSAVPISPWWLF
jgi:hypothetical protein